MSKREKALLFVEHIERHLKDLEIKGKVQCKICNRTIDEAAEIEKKRQQQEKLYGRSSLFF